MMLNTIYEIFSIFFLLIENVLTLETRKQDSFSSWSYTKIINLRVRKSYDPVSTPLDEHFWKLQNYIETKYEYRFSVTPKTHLVFLDRT